ncbi:hypothetical protein AB0E25_33510 [Streptomyces bobili]|uniref:hypothetical protein n=1 Tax=Streptomyces bobili TaxID=67280 RepID=UPI0033D477FC|nr:hypothetical protein [Nonomuraea muscovyensis]
MVQRVADRENERPGTARKRFDGQLGVRDWAVVGDEDREPEPRDSNAPWWWDSAEEASQSFLASMGVNLA